MRLSTPNSSIKKRKPLNESSVFDSDDTKSKPKKSKLNSSTNDTEILTHLGLTTNNHLTPLRKNNSLLDRPEVTTPVSKYLFYIE